MSSEPPSPAHTHLPLHVFLSGWSMKPMGQLQWTPVAASWHLLSQPPLLTAHVSAWQGERKAVVRDCCSKGWDSHSTQMSPVAQPGSGSGSKPPRRAHGNRPWLSHNSNEEATEP